MIGDPEVEFLPGRPTVWERAISGIFLAALIVAAGNAIGGWHLFGSYGHIVLACTVQSGSCL